MNGARYKVKSSQLAILLKAEHQFSDGDARWFDNVELCQREEAK